MPNDGMSDAERLAQQIGAQEMWNRINAPQKSMIPEGIGQELPDMKRIRELQELDDELKEGVNKK